MGVMEQMRKGTGVILWVLIFSFGVLWMLADTNMFDVIQQGPRSLGAVNGENISLEEYNNLMSSYIEQYSRESGNSVTPEMRANFEQQAWDDLITGKLLQQKMDDLGIEVTDQEVVDMITGENPDPFIKQQFQREDGTIDRVALQSAIEAPENTQLWITIEQQMRQKRRQQKMSNYLQSSMEVSSYEVEQQYIRNNTTADVSYIRLPYADVEDSDISVTDSDLRTYYNNHQDKYERKESYRFEYVSFDKSATKQDTMRTIKEMKNLRSDFAQAENDSLFLNRYQSTTSYNAELVDKSEVRELYKPVLDVGEGEVTEVIRDQGRIYLLKKLEETSDQVRFVVFSMDIKADPIATIDKQAEAADDFSFFAQEEGFSAESERRELDVKEAFATKDNDFISGLGQSRQIMSFLESSDEGAISTPIELSGQIVVLNVTEITPAGTQPLEEVKEQIRTVVINNKRKQHVVNRVNELLSQNSEFENLAQAVGKEVNTAEGLTMNSAAIEGAGREPKVVGAIFGLQEGEISKPIAGTSAVFVARIDMREDADLQNLTPDTRQQIRRRLQQQKSTAFMNTWIDQLKEEADIEDNRSRVLQG